ILFVAPIPLLTKEFLEVGTLDPDPVIKPGDDVVLRFTITNTSTTSGATDIEFLDELTDGSSSIPPDLTSGFLPFPVTVTLPPDPDPPCGTGSSLALVSAGTDRVGLELTGGSLDAAPGTGDTGATCTFDVTVTIPTDMAAGTYTNTTEEITATVDDATHTGLPASDTLTVIAAPSLSKAFTDDPVGPGDTVTLEFTLTYSPDASGDATAITFTDDLTFLASLTATGLPVNEPCGTGSSLTGSAGDTLLTFAGGTLEPGESCTFSVTLNVPAGAASDSYTNTTSTVVATVEGELATSMAGSDNLIVADLVFTKEFVGDPVIAGETLTLRFSIENIHPTEDATNITFTDNLNAVLSGLTATLPASSDNCGGTLSGTSSLTYTGGSVLSGQTCTIEVKVLVPLGTADGTYNNMTNNLSTSLGTIDPAVDTLAVNSNLIELTKSFTDAPVAPGDTVTLELTLTNLDADRAASAIAFTDDLGATLTDLTFDSVLLNTCGATVTGINTTLITVANASISGGASCTIQASLSVPAAAAADTYTNTTSGVTGTIGGFSVSGDAASDNLEVIQLLEFSKSFDGPTAATNTAILTFTITNPGLDAATGITFLDNLDDVITGLQVTGSLPTDPCGSGSTVSGTSLLLFSGGELSAMGGTCSFYVTVQVPSSASAGTYTNTTSDLSQNGLKVAEPATADLQIEPKPTFAKVFTPDGIGQGLTSALTFTIDNSTSAINATALDFSDSLPTGVVVATPANASTTCSGGTITAVAGSGVISYSGGSVSAGANCTVKANVTGSSVGSHFNTTGDLTSSSGNSGTASDTLTVVSPPSFSKAFAPSAIPGGGTSTLTFTINNSNNTFSATSLDFSDTLPTGVVVATPANASTTCTGGTVTATNGSGSISYTGGSVGASSSCTVQAD
ncbi:MAG: hypothetical protein GY703_04895, partial [Gammaproteobacteria bacterium]|nr:hypothetical protein [Gammaproteobacteria bacterium]